MTAISREDIKKLSRLNRIAINSETQDLLAKQVEHVISWVDSLSKVDTDGIEPMNNTFDGPMRMADDVAKDGNIADEITKNAPAKIYGYFAVPKVIE